jgi:hypothetical protein
MSVSESSNPPTGEAVKEAIRETEASGSMPDGLTEG